MLVLINLGGVIINAARIHRIDVPTAIDPNGYVVLIDDQTVFRLSKEETAQLMRTLNRLHDRDQLVYL